MSSRDAVDQGRNYITHWVQIIFVLVISDGAELIPLLVCCLDVCRFIAYAYTQKDAGNIPAFADDYDRSTFQHDDFATEHGLGKPLAMTLFRIST